jgi:hypothetical protein
MRRNRVPGSALLCVLPFLWLSLEVIAAQAPASPPAATLSCADMEAFLTTARIGRQRSLPVGVTVPSRAILDDGKLQHEAIIQTVDVTKASHPTGRGTELNFRDSWQFNVTGYELAKMLELNMVPPYVERKVSGVPASVSWLVPDVMMERDRFQKKLTPPDMKKWNEEILAARVFHELIADTDYNMTNLLITKDWRTWMIDFSRAFRRTKSLQEPKGLTAIDRKLLANLRGLTKEALQQRLGRWLNKPEIDAVLARRDLIVRAFEDQIAAKGEAAVLHDLPRTSEPCGAGLQ